MTAAGRPLVSVILPTHERPEYLRRAVESVLAQTYDCLELIVVDDHSSTPAHQVLADVSFDSLVDVRHVRHSENRGANAARNNGIRAATGTYIAFLDDDDLWEPEKIERQVECFEDAGPDVGVVYTGVKYIGPNGTGLFVQTPTARGDVTEDILVGKSIAEFSAVMVRSDVIPTARLLDERFPSWQDREWYVRLSKHCRFEPVPEPLMIRQMGHGDQINTDFEAKRDVSYPLFLEKHRPLAAEYGRMCERKFVASLSEMLGMSAFKNGYYAEARTYLMKAILSYPFATNRYLYLFSSLGGRTTHRLSRGLVKVMRLIR